MPERLKAEERALAPKKALKLLRGVLPDGEEIRRVARIEEMKRRPGRRLTLRYEIEIDGGSADGRRVIYAKLYRGRRGERLHDALGALAQRDLGSLHLPRSLGYDARHRVLFLSELAGDSLAQRLGAAAGEAALAGFGGALARFHAAARRSPATEPAEDPRAIADPRDDPGPAVPGELPRHDAQAEETIVAEAATRIGPLPDRVRARFSRVAAKLQDGLTRDAPAAAAALIHRDLYPEQVIVMRDGFGLVDLDELSLGEAELDLGNFVAHLLLADHQADRDESRARERAARFLASYEDVARFSRERVRLYTAASCLRLASLERLGAAERSHLNWPDLAALLVADAEAQVAYLRDSA